MHQNISNLPTRNLECLIQNSIAI